MILARGGNGGFVGDIRKVGTTTSGCLSSKSINIYILCDRLVFEVDFEDFDTIFALRKRNVDVTIETTRAEESLIEHIYAVRRGNHNDTRIVIKTIRLKKNGRPAMDGHSTI